MMKQFSPWQALDLDSEDLEKASDENKALQLDLKRKFQATFETVQGRWVLEYLNGRFLMGRVVDENAKHPLVSAGIREGEMRVIHAIHRLIAPEKDND